MLAMPSTVAVGGQECTQTGASEGQERDTGVGYDSWICSGVSLSQAVGTKKSRSQLEGRGRTLMNLKDGDEDKTT